MRSPEGHREWGKEDGLERGGAENEGSKRGGGASTRRSSTLQKELQELQKVLDGKRAILRETCKTQTEGNNEVWVLNENTDKAMTLLTTIYEMFENASEEMVKET